MKTFSELLGENRKKMAESAAEKGNEKVARSNFKLAADAYRAAAGENSQEKGRLLALADEMDSLSEGDLGRYYTPPASAKHASATPKTQQAAKSEAKPADNADKPEKKTEVDETELGEALAELNGLIGLTEVKTRINEWVDQIRLFKVREQRGLPVPPITYHMVFTGNPGTGKTTVARLIAKIYHALGIIRENKCKEVGREDLVAQYVGQTAIKTKEVLDEALGGILFIDEAYTLKKEGNDFGQEAIDTLLKVMEDQRDEISIIAAGYEEDMQKFIKSNAGLSSRFKNFINFADYDGADLLNIFEMNCKKRKYVLTPESKQICKKYFNDLYAGRDETFGNARDVRNFFEDVVTKQAVRLSRNGNPTDEELCTLLPEDVVSVTGGKEDLAATTVKSDVAKTKDEYDRISKDNSASVISGEISKGNFDGAVVALCVRLESVLKYKYNLEGDLFTMIDEFIASKGGDEKYRILHKLRMKRNTLVHSDGQSVDFTKSDLISALAIVEEMDGKSGEISEVADEKERNLFDYAGGSFVNPSLDLLNDAENNASVREANKRDIDRIIGVLVDKLKDFGIKVAVEDCIVGAAYSRIEMKLLSNTQLTTIAKYEPDIAMVLKRKIRLLLPVEGKDLIGIEVQNARREVLTLKAMLMSEEGRKRDGKISTGIGYDIEGKPVFASFDSLPHALVGGSTGSGKSVFLSSVITGIIFRYQPKDVRLVLIDFKRVEMNVYNGLPFVVGGKAIDDFDETREMFVRLTDEMERRYTLLSESRTRNFKEYNEKVGERNKLPAIVIIIDEYADMVSDKGYKELAANIQRIAQKARAAGMYMIIATQRPSAKVIDGVIKANLPSRIAFSVASHIDSMNILDASGAEDLIGAGDMLFEQGGYIKRLQSPYIGTEEIGRVADSIIYGTDK